MGLNPGQRAAVKYISGWWKGNSSYLVLDAKGGCVDCDTEFLTPTGWKRIADYEEGDLVCEWSENKFTEFAAPEAFHKIPSTTLTKVQSKTITMTLSKEHRVPYISARGVFNVASLEDSLGKASLVIPRGFKTPYNVGGLALSDALIRVLVMQSADGTAIPTKNYKISINVKKERKKVRVITLLEEANIPYTITKSSKDYIRVNYYTPESIQTKSLCCFYGASERQLKVMVDEVVLWDGYTAYRKNVITKKFTGTKSNAEVVQYAMSAISGNYVSCTKDKRTYVNGDLYNVSASSRDTSFLQLTANGKNKAVEVSEEQTVDGFKYCFTTSTSFWLARKDGYIFPTGNCGKTYLIDHILPLLHKCDPLLLTPTNESLNQLREKLSDPDQYLLKTVHSALGIRPTTSKKDLAFEVGGKLPSLWESINLAVVDEASMISEELLAVLMETKVKILWVGHSSQLPPIIIRRKRTDLCESPVFKQGWETITLSQPMRNTGDLWKFNNQVEAMIYNSKLQLPDTYNVRKRELTDFLKSDAGKEGLLSGETKVVAWSNAGVDKLNTYLRSTLFGKEKAKSKYVEHDRIIFTKPYNLVENLDRYRESGLLGLMNDKGAITSFYSNTKATVINCKEVVVKLNAELVIPCYKLKVLCEEDTHFIYEIKDPRDLKLVADYYEHIAWGKKSGEARAKVYRQRHFLLSCFSELKHYFAATSHRLQGASIPNIIVIWNDILKNPNRIERSKCAYVSTSRTVDSLRVFKGFL